MYRDKGHAMCISASVQQCWHRVASLLLLPSQPTADCLWQPHAEKRPSFETEFCDQLAVPELPWAMCGFPESFGHPLLSVCALSVGCFTLTTRGTSPAVVSATVCIQEQAESCHFWAFTVRLKQHNVEVLVGPWMFIAGFDSK